MFGRPNAARVGADEFRRVGRCWTRHGSSNERFTSAQTFIWAQSALVTTRTITEVCLQVL